MELEKEIIELKAQLSLAMLLANKALDMAIQAQVEAKSAKETQVKRIEIPPADPMVQQFIDEMTGPKDDEPEAVESVPVRLSPFAMFDQRRKVTEATGIDAPQSDEDEIWDEATA